MVTKNIVDINLFWACSSVGRAVTHNILVGSSPGKLPNFIKN